MNPRSHSVRLADNTPVLILDPPRQGRDLPERYWAAKAGEHHYYRHGSRIGHIRFAVEWVDGGWYWLDQRRTLGTDTVHGPFVTSANAWWHARTHFNVSAKDSRKEQS